MNTPSYVGSGGPEGAFTEEFSSGARIGDSLLPIPDDLPFEIAALTEPLAVALHGVNRAQAKPGDKVAVFGCGPIGLGMVLWLVDRGVTDVVALDLAPERLERAKALGARAGRSTKKIFAPDFSNCMARSASSAARPSAPTPLSMRRARRHSFRCCEDGEIPFAHGRYGGLLCKPVELDLGAMLTSEMTITTAVGYPHRDAGGDRRPAPAARNLPH